MVDARQREKQSRKHEKRETRKKGHNRRCSSYSALDFVFLDFRALVIRIWLQMSDQLRREGGGGSSSAQVPGQTLARLEGLAHRALDALGRLALADVLQ